MAEVPEAGDTPCRPARRCFACHSDPGRAARFAVQRQSCFSDSREPRVRLLANRDHAVHLAAIYTVKTIYPMVNAE